MDRAEKKELVTALNEVFKATSVVVVAHYSGLTVAQMQTLRRQMKQAGATVKVAKNRLAKIALEGTDVASIASLLKGPTVIAYSSDPVAAPKVAIDFAKANEQVRDPRRSDGQDRPQPDGVKAACFAAVSRRTAREDRRPDPGAGDQDRPARQRTRGEGRARGAGLCLEERSGVRRRSQNSTGSNQ